MMKTLLSFLMLFGCIISANAQPTIPASKFYVPGSILNYLEADTVGTTPGPSGANQTWNFAAAISLGSGYSNAVVNAAGTYFASSFPGSNIAITDPYSTDTTFSYVTRNASSFQVNGFGLMNQGTPITFTYSNPQKYADLPLTYNTTFTDSYSGLATISQPPLTVQLYRNGSSTTIVDGWGTLITPAGTYTNCLRVKRTDESHDSVVYVGVPLPAEVTITFTTNYTWFDGATAIARDLFSYTHDSTITSAGTEVSNSATYLASVTTGLSSLAQPLNLSVYPNPANTELNFIPTKGQYGISTISISDLTGRIIMTQEIEMLQSVPVSVSVAAMNAGIYLMQVDHNGQRWSSRFIKQ